MRCQWEQSGGGVVDRRSRWRRSSGGGVVVGGANQQIIKHNRLPLSLVFFFVKYFSFSSKRTIFVDDFLFVTNLYANSSLRSNSELTWMIFLFVNQVRHHMKMFRVKKKYSCTFFLASRRCSFSYRFFFRLFLFLNFSRHFFRACRRQLPAAFLIFEIRAHARQKSHLQFNSSVRFCFAIFEWWRVRPLSFVRDTHAHRQW